MLAARRDAVKAASELGLFKISTPSSRRASKLGQPVTIPADGDHGMNSTANRNRPPCIDLPARQRSHCMKCKRSSCMPETGHDCARRARRMPGEAGMWLVQPSHSSHDSARAPKHSFRERVSCDLRPLQQLSTLSILPDLEVILGLRHQLRLHMRA